MARELIERLAIEDLKKRNLVGTEENVGATTLIKTIYEETRSFSSIRFMGGRDARGEYKVTPADLSHVGETIDPVGVTIVGPVNVGGRGIIYLGMQDPVSCAAIHHPDESKGTLRRKFESLGYSEFCRKYSIRLRDRLWACKKILERVKKEGKTAVARFENEGRILGKINHPNVPKTIFADPDVIVSRYYPCTSPVDLLRNRNYRERWELWKNGVKVMKEIEEQARERGQVILHRDQKPDNWLAIRGAPSREEVKKAWAMDLYELVIIDWGQSIELTPKELEIRALKVKGGTRKELEIESFDRKELEIIKRERRKLFKDRREERKGRWKITQTEIAEGTPPYFPPEVVRAGLEAYTESSEVYGIGTILYELWAGRPPFILTKEEEKIRVEQYGENPSLIIVRKITSWAESGKNGPPSLREANPTIPESLDKIVGDFVFRVMSRDPEKRPKTIAELYQGILDIERSFPRLIETGEAPVKLFAIPTKTQAFSIEDTASQPLSEAEKKAAGDREKIKRLKEEAIASVLADQRSPPQAQPQPCQDGKWVETEGPFRPGKLEGILESPQTAPEQTILYTAEDLTAIEATADPQRSLEEKRLLIGRLCSILRQHYQLPPRRHELPYTPQQTPQLQSPKEEATSPQEDDIVEESDSVIISGSSSEKTIEVKLGKLGLNRESPETGKSGSDKKD
jgi:serine/threonine protein kinase